MCLFNCIQRQNYEIKYVCGFCDNLMAYLIEAGYDNTLSLRVKGSWANSDKEEFMKVAMRKCSLIERMSNVDRILLIAVTKL